MAVKKCLKITNEVSRTVKRTGNIMFKKMKHQTKQCTEDSAHQTL